MIEGILPVKQLGTSIYWHPVGAIAARLLLGGVFLYSGLQKFQHVNDLARIIYNYRIIHLEMVNFIAISLPWLELLIGVCLLFGILRRSSALTAFGLFIMFGFTIWLAIIRGIHGSCGCFSVSGSSEQIGWLILLRNTPLLALSLYLLMHPSRAWELESVFWKENHNLAGESTGF